MTTYTVTKDDRQYDIFAKNKRAAIAKARYMGIASPFTITKKKS